MLIPIDIMAKNIKITEKQYRKLLETTEDTFSYVTDSDTIPNDGLKNITANGKLDGEKNAKPTTGDKIQKSLTPQSYNRYAHYGNVTPRPMREGVDITNKEDNTADDIGETDAFDIDKLENPKLVQIPNTVQKRMELFVDSISNLNPMQKAVVLNKLRPYLTSDSTTYHQQKKDSKYIEKSKLNVPNQIKKNIGNND